MIHNELLKLLQDSIVRIKINDSDFGSGFYITPSLILTCSHVVEDFSKKDRTIPIIWKGTSVSGKVLVNFPKPYPDISLIETDPGDSPCVWLDHLVELNDQFYTFGGTSSYIGDSVTLTFEGFSFLDHETVLCPKPYLLKLRQGQVEPGLSGAPILNVRTGGVCGIIKTTRNSESDLGGRGIPTEVVYSLIPNLKELQIAFHSQNTKWRDLLTNEQKKTESWKGFLEHQTASKQKVSQYTIQNKIRQEHRNLFNRYISGSYKIKIEDLIADHHSLMIPFRWVSPTPLMTDKISLVQYLTSDSFSSYGTDSCSEKAKSSGNRYLILAEPGVGKSTLTYKIFWELSNIFFKELSKGFPVYIDLRDYIGEDSFGTREWVVSLLVNLTGMDQDLLSERHYFDSNTGNNYHIILDSLDEYLAGFDRNSIQRELSKYIFQRANIITCRSQFFERYLKLSPFASNFQHIKLLEWKVEDIKSYILSYSKFCFDKEADTISADIYSRINNSDKLSDLCQIPLRLNMTLELFFDPDCDVKEIENVLYLYEVYVSNWLKRESYRAGSILDFEVKDYFLREVSWAFYDDAILDYSKSPKITIDRLKLLIENLLSEGTDTYKPRDILNDLLFHSLLTRRARSLFQSGIPSVYFIHKSFQEYFVSRYFYDSMISSASTTSSNFCQIISPSVSEFLKEYIYRINNDITILNSVVKICIQAYKENLIESEDTHTSARRRIARQQLAYYIGNLKSLVAVSFLHSRLESETDLWIRRGIFIGLAFGGNEEFLHKYIDLLRKEREHGYYANENQINTGFHLSFFGDQPLDELHPELDQGLPVCENTFKALVYQLGTETDRGSWRLNLYTLLDLGRFRASSRDNFHNILNTSANELERILAKLKNDKSCNWWPEIIEMENYIMTMHCVTTRRNSIIEV